MNVPTKLMVSVLTVALASLLTHTATVTAANALYLPTGVNLDEDKIKEEEEKTKTIEVQNTPEADSKESDSSERKRNNPRKNTTKREKYVIRDYQPCVPGTEDIKGCNSNPDQPTCPDGTYPIDRQLLDQNGRLVTQYRYCPGDPPRVEIPEDSLIEPVPLQIIITVEKFRSYPIKGSRIQSSPNKFSLRNGHTHFWASKDVQEFKSEISERNVRIKAIPIQWNWNYGDGSKRNLNFPGEAMPGHTLHDETPTSHSYSETGKFGVGVTTLYRGEFSVDGGPWQAIPGQAAVPSNTLPMDVWRTEKELIAND